MLTKCPKCGAKYEVAGDMAGRKLRCAECRTVFAAPPPPAAAVEPPPAPAPAPEPAPAPISAAPMESVALPDIAPPEPEPEPPLPVPEPAPAPAAEKAPPQIMLRIAALRARAAAWREAVRARLPRRLPSPALPTRAEAAWLGGCAAVVAASSVLMLCAFRYRLASGNPAWEARFRAVGLESVLPEKALEFADLTWREAGGELRISGKVRNTSAADLRLPSVVLALKDARGKVAQSGRAENLPATVAAGGSVPFSFAAPALPDTATAMLALWDETR
ncbi:hypothetical protein FACS1894186_3710 [Alphaproteobacteria bacterium]|nr:hypothetical protein FACS1894186_3710 [Alphaproteobacteria bacterium]